MVFGPAENAGHRLFIVYVRDGAIQQLGDLVVDAPAGHVPVLRHGHLGVPEMVRTDACREPGVVDKSCHGLAEAVRRHLGHPEVVADGAPGRIEVFRVAQRSAAGCEDRLLLADERALATNVGNRSSLGAGVAELRCPSVAKPACLTALVLFNLVLKR